MRSLLVIGVVLALVPACAEPRPMDPPKVAIAPPTEVVVPAAREADAGVPAPSPETDAAVADAAPAPLARRVEPIALAAVPFRTGAGALVLSSSKAGRVEMGAPTVTGNVAPSVVGSAVQPRRAALLNCYERGLRANPLLTGTMMVQVVFSDKGSVKFVGYASQTLDADVARCVATHFGYVRLPGHDEGEVTFVAPLRFQPPPGG